MQIYKIIFNFDFPSSNRGHNPRNSLPRGLSVDNLLSGIAAHLHQQDMARCVWQVG